ncbi:hypothetical protein BIW11_00505 [Tropilaelaps mercedesae]|uniref:Uncharacterized protein n=1 Tax=Tropilaelaps mercedesae TaxID=418985 RepID=A0A1V9XU61_9ACAR|nr:hypothetical protein BIW11_00505 [Tropilaelaps mercedesae]
MASTDQWCTLCAKPLLKFLYNTDGDYILNCSSPTCLYGVLHSRLYKADALAELEQALPVANGHETDMPDFSTMLNDDLVADLNDGYGTTKSDVQMECRLSAKEDHMIDSWVQELMEASKDPPAVEMSSAPSPIDVNHSSGAEPRRQAPKGKRPIASKLRPETATTTSSLVRRSAREVTATEKAKAIRNTVKPKRNAQRGTAGSAVLRKAQAKVAALRANFDLTDETTSEAGSSDSGVQSDLSTNSATATMTPIQRLLHIEEAKKRSWGTTGMPGFKPSAIVPSRLKLY